MGERWVRQETKACRGQKPLRTKEGGEVGRRGERRVAARYQRAGGTCTAVDLRSRADAEQWRSRRRGVVRGRGGVKVIRTRLYEHRRRDSARRERRTPLWAGLGAEHLGEERRCFKWGGKATPLRTKGKVKTTKPFRPKGWLAGHRRGGQWWRAESTKGEGLGVAIDTSRPDWPRWRRRGVAKEAKSPKVGIYGRVGCKVDLGGVAPEPCRLPGSGEPVVKRLDGGWRSLVYENQRSALARRERRGAKTGPYVAGLPSRGNRNRWGRGKQRRAAKEPVKAQVPTGRKPKGTRSTKRSANTHKRTRPGAWWARKHQASTYPWWIKDDEEFRGRPIVHGEAVWPLERREERNGRGGWGKGVVGTSGGGTVVRECKRPKIGTRQIGSLGTHGGEGGVPIGRREWVWRPESGGAGRWEGLIGTGLGERRNKEDGGAKGRGVVTEDYERRPSGREASKVERQRGSKVELRRLGCARDHVRFAPYARRQQRDGNHDVVVDKRKGVDRTTGEVPVPSEWNLEGRRVSRQPRYKWGRPRRGGTRRKQVW